jgi:hypothetical protein
VLSRSRESKRRLVTVAATMGAVVLFVWSIRAARFAVVLNGVRRVGFRFVAIVLLAGIPQLLRAAAWRCCLESRDRLSLADAFLACVAGDSLGNVTPFGLLASPIPSLKRNCRTACRRR